MQTTLSVLILREIMDKRAGFCVINHGGIDPFMPFKDAKNNHLAWRALYPVCLYVFRQNSLAKTPPRRQTHPARQAPDAKR